MKIIVERTDILDERTFGVMYIDGERFCDTLEDRDRRLEECGCGDKVYAHTAIPRGKYNAKPHWWVKHQNWYLWIQDVPCFSGILVHGGWDEKDSAGCVLIGTRVGDRALTNTKATVARFRQMIMKASQMNEQITVEIR